MYSYEYQTYPNFYSRRCGNKPSPRESRRHVYDISTNVCLATYLTLGVSATTKKDFNELEVMYPWSKDHQIQTVPFVLEYTDVEGTVWTENKLVRVRTVNETEDSEDRFTAGQAGYNPIKQQWAVTAVHQILESRAQAQSEEEYNLLTQEAKKLSYAHQIVSPVVSFLVRKPKSSLNLINSRLGGDSDERERRSSPQQQETHEIR